MAVISEACALESKLVDLLEQFVLIVSCSFPLYLPVTHQAMPWQILFGKPFKKAGLS